MRAKTFIIILLVIGALFLIKKFLLPSEQTPAGGGQGRGAPVAVDVKIITPVIFDEVVQSTGTILANEEVTLKAEVAGRITKLLIKEGGKVNRGDLLVKINDAELRAQLSKVASGLQLAEQPLERNKKLLTIEGISREEYDVLQTEVESLKAEKDVILAQIDKTEIRAPFNGVLGLKQISEGAYVTSLQDIITLQQLDPLKLEFSIPENYLGRVKTGDTVTYSLSGQTTSYIGTVYAIEPVVNAGSRSINIRAYCSNSSTQVLPGAFARIKLRLSSSNSLLVPTQAIVPVLKGKQLFIVRSGKADTVSVSTGVRNDTAIQILSGLTAGDTVIITGLLQLRPGSEIKLRNKSTL
ncbi:MAG: efflux RND transporter periplasmic adaptor subunit [Bacteroidetes bacterium]|nr:efflux RND transporter periplasmic adaptor subunit [Bacteroidota bacterium]